MNTPATAIAVPLLPVVALVGRPNVGKSTLFNALTRSRDALVADQPGLTRDRHYGFCREQDTRPFVVVDTGGLTGEDEGMDALTARQAWAAIEESDIVVLMLDARDGLLGTDRDILAKLRRSGKPLVVAVNKIDGLEESSVNAEFSALGIAARVPIAAAHRRGIDVLVATVLAQLPESFAAPPVDAPRSSEKPPPEPPRVAMVGRPNVGKSTLVNRLLGEERVIASPIPGTTRDAIEIPLTRDGLDYVLVDTAGVRRRGKVDEAVEKFSVIKTLQAIERAHVVVVLIDAAEGVTDQDATVIGHVLDAGRALVLAANKWDGLAAHARERVKSELERKFVFVPWAEQVFISALHGSGLGELLKAVQRAHASASRVFSSSELTKAIEFAVEKVQPPMVRGRAAKLRYAHIGGNSPLRVIVHGSRLAALPDSYRRYLENFLRDRYELVGVPIRVELRDGENPFAGRKNVLTEGQVRKRRRLIKHVKRR